MRAIVIVVVLILVASASASHAATGRVNCDKMKTTAAAKAFSEFLSCNHKGFADNSFDLGVCRTKAYEKCYTKFGVADAKFGGECAFSGNGGACLDTLNAANSIFDGI